MADQWRAAAPSPGPSAEIALLTPPGAAEPSAGAGEGVELSGAAAQGAADAGETTTGITTVDTRPEPEASAGASDLEEAAEPEASAAAPAEAGGPRRVAEAETVPGEARGPAAGPADAASEGGAEPAPGSIGEAQSEPAGEPAPEAAGNPQPQTTGETAPEAVGDPQPQTTGETAPGVDAGAPPAAAPTDPEAEASVPGIPTWTFAVAEPADPVAGTPPLTVPGAPSSPAALAPPQPPALAPPAPPPPPVAEPLRPASPASVAAATLSVPSLGPPGRRRHPAAVALLSVLTLGLYAIAWHARINREMSELDARIEVSPDASALAAALAWVPGMACSLAGAALIVAHAFNAGPVIIPASAGFMAAGRLVPWDYLMLAGIVAIPYLAVLLPVPLTAVLMTLERVRVVQERVGVRPDRQMRPARHAWMLLIPVVGGLWHVASVQARLNQVWHRAASPLRPEPGRR